MFLVINDRNKDEKVTQIKQWVIFITEIKQEKLKVCFIIFRLKSFEKFFFNRGPEARAKFIGQELLAEI